MKNFRGLIFLALVAIFAFAFIFVGHVFVQGQVTTKGKPAKPPGQDKAAKYVWSAVILDESATGFGLRGIEAARYDDTWPGWVYEDTESNVNVSVRIGSAPYDGEIKYSTTFRLEIFHPAQIALEFDPWDAWFYDETPDPLSKYPGGYDPTLPFSMFEFMEDSFHPHPEYDCFEVFFKTDRSVNQTDIDYEQWVYHDIMNFIARIETPPMTLFKPATCEDLNLSEYSSIEFGGNEYGYFERIDENTWKVVVGQEKFPPYDYFGWGEIGEDDAWATDWYQICLETQYNKNKTGVTYDAIFSAQGQFDIKFAILFIRTKI